MPLLASTLVVLLGATPQAEDVPTLLRARTAQLLDAITRGDPSVWEQALEAGARVIDENGEVLDRKAMVASVRPLPPGIGGAIRPVDFQATVVGDVATTTYVADEDETFHGAKIHARYRMGDTWVRREGAWKLLSSQVLALRTDPPAVPTTPEQRKAYCGRYTLGDLTYVVRWRVTGFLQRRESWDLAWKRLD